MTQQFNPTTWIDEQRRAGAARGNVFDEILKAAASIRSGQTKKADYRVEARVARVHAIRAAAADHDRDIGANGMVVRTLCGDAVPSFGQMVQRWKGQQETP